MATIRVRQITDNLDYQKMLDKNLIPDLSKILATNYPEISIKKQYPKYVYQNKGYSFFGQFIEYVIKAMLRIRLPETEFQSLAVYQDPTLDKLNSEYNTKQNINDIFKISYQLLSYYTEQPISFEDLKKYIPTSVNITKELLVYWNAYIDYLSGKVIYEEELKCQHIVGHPDIIAGKAVLDVKNSMLFSKMLDISCLQVLAYYALLRYNNREINSVGLVLPMQRIICMCDLTEWDSEPFLHYLLSHSKIKSPEMIGTVIIDESTGVCYDGNGDVLSKELKQIMCMQFDVQFPQSVFLVGNHIKKGKNIVQSIGEYYQNKPGHPCQMFLRSARSGKCSSHTKSQLDDANSIIMALNINYYTHAAYITNLCSNAQDELRCWAQEYLNEDLIFTKRMGGKGVVVHTGQYGEKNLKEALDTMELMVRKAITDSASEDCPLLLETPCGEGTEVCAKIEDFIAFFNRFSKSEKKKLGICIDSAHVWGAGYDPYYYIKKWSRESDVKIKLVHYNDSAVKKGSRVDRHAPPGYGEIGLNIMTKIACWCYQNGIPMVRE